ncbi:isochorismatase family protein [Aeromicrobium sp. 636]|uniref:Isochorismatase family protein n=1 Tax=Aeromicrobium senzhongii TaxID=2663859 RepID=A0A8I0EUQ9_9ACTN|nr:isochorismatase family protein [Aeromicrobium sp. 636]MBC9225978.1 isochorismatase family protein [Aeromicrobium senzhongii]MCQ3998085.1 isochorismatase family protein [Aeromicrobium sp. 636]
MSTPWLVVIDPQRVFAAADSPWASPMFGSIVEPIRELAGTHRTIVTRWVPAAGPERTGSWAAYFEAWPFADRPARDPLFDLVPEVADLAAEGTVDATTFGKWPALERITGPAPELLLTGVATDCCVISTALAAADAGATVRVVAQACGGSTPENHAKALDVMALYGPQITVV